MKVNLKTNISDFMSDNIRSEKEYEEFLASLNSASDEDVADVMQQQWVSYIGDIEGRSSRLSSRRDRRWGWLAVACCMILAICGFALKLYVDNQQFIRQSKQLISINTGKHERVTVSLPDGTSVKLNSESTLSYAQDFGTEHRQVFLSGEGYFMVAHDAEKKFVVNNEFLDVTVHGTTFNVNAYHDQKEVEVALIEGKVAVAAHDRDLRPVVLAPNTKAIYDKTTRTFNIRPTSMIETAWISDVLVFKSQPIGNVLRVLEKKFDVKIIVSERFDTEDTYTGYFDDESLSEILYVLKSHYGFKYQINKDTVVINY